MHGLTKSQAQIFKIFHWKVVYIWRKDTENVTLKRTSCGILDLKVSIKIYDPEFKDRYLQVQKWSRALKYFWKF